MTNPERMQTTAAARLTSAIDDTFRKGVPKRGGALLRDDEESLGMVPAMPLSHCPAASSFRLERPIPVEGDQISPKESEASYRVVVYELGGRIQTNFLASGDDVRMRRTISYSRNESPSDADSSYVIGPEALSGDALAVLSGLEKATAPELRDRGEVMFPEAVDEFLGWIDMATPYGDEQPA